jgi:hypothetical protein
MRSPAARSTRTRTPPKFLLGGFTYFFGELEIGRGVPGQLAFFCGRSNQRRCYRLSGWRLRTQRRGIGGERKRGNGFEKFAT